MGVGGVFASGYFSVMKMHSPTYLRYKELGQISRKKASRNTQTTPD